MVNQTHKRFIYINEYIGKLLIHHFRNAAFDIMFMNLSSNEEGNLQFEIMHKN